MLGLDLQYEFWCEEASSTIVRVGKYSSECKTKEAISSLREQFEKFVWPTVPQQEERIRQITELAVRLHGEMMVLIPTVPVTIKILIDAREPMQKVKKKKTALKLHFYSEALLNLKVLV